MPAKINARAAAIVAIAALVMLPVSASAQETLLDAGNSGDTAWIMASALLSMLVTLPGIVLLHAGRVRAGDAISVALQIGAVAATASLLWIVVGYTLAFGTVSNGWLGNGNAWMLIELGNVRRGTDVPESAFVMFQAGFAMLAPALMTGAWAGRARFSWVIGFTALWSLVVYAPVTHWIWGSGWLASSVGTLDWSGGLTVHLTAGVSALVTAAMLGPRRAPQNGAATGHAPLLALVGALLFWIGTLAQAGGYALTASDDAAAAMIACHGAAVSGALAWLLVERLRGGNPNATGFAIGAVAGLAAVSAPAGFVSPGGAIVIGAIGALGSNAVLRIVRNRLEIDDALGIFAIHGIGGLLGVLLTGPFMAETLGGVGFGEGSNAVAQTVAQAIGAGVILAWSALATALLTLIASALLAMRVSEESESIGLDRAAHAERSWHVN